MTTETFFQLLVIVLFDNFWVIIAFFEEIIYWQLILLADFHYLYYLFKIKFNKKFTTVILLKFRKTLTKDRIVSDIL